MLRNKVCLMFFAIAYGVAFLPIKERMQIVIIGGLFVSFCVYAIIYSYRKWRVDRRDRIMGAMHNNIKNKIKESGDADRI